MGMNGDFWRRMGLPWQRRPHFEDEVDDELRFHVEMRARELMAAGMEEGEALRSASERFGDLGDTRRRYVSGRARRGRKGRRRQWLLDLGQDLRYGLRAAGRRPGFSAAVIAVLALGIGAPTTVFTLVDAIFFQRPPHIEAPDELVRVFRAWAPGVGGGNIEYDDYRYYRDNASTLSGLAAYGGLGVAAYRTSGGERDQLRLQFVSDNYFEVLGTTPHLGRWFLEAENSSPGRDPVVVVGHGFWTRALGGDPEAVGRSLQINGTEMTVIGVAPDGFAGTANAGPAPDAWTPIAMRGVLARLEDTAWWSRSSEFRERWLDAVGRLAPGVTFEAARDNLVALGEGLAYEGKSPEEGALVSNQVLYRPRQDRELSSLSRMLVAAVFVVLAVAAANVAVLLLSRGAGRSREMAVRTALGAGASRLVRQLLTETVILGAAGGLLGVTLAFAFADLAATLLPVPLNASFAPDGWVLAAATVISLATSILVGLAPALQGARTEVRSAMQDQSLHPGRGRLRGGLVVVQIGLSVVLLAGALMFAASFAKASSQDLGFDPEDVAVLETNLRNLGYDPDQGRVLHRQALDRLAALPGVSAVALSRQLPFGGEWSTSFEAPEGAVANAPDNQMDVGLNAVGPGYFELMGIPIVEGRALAAEHGDGGLAGVVVNETLAEALWPGEPAAGRVLDVGTPFTVVGVARDAVYYRLDEGPGPRPISRRPRAIRAPFISS